MFLRMENIKVLGGDYTVFVSSKGIAHFANRNQAVEKIINDHNGFLEFISQKEGAKIKILLPRYVNWNFDNWWYAFDFTKTH